MNKGYILNNRQGIAAVAIVGLLMGYFLLSGLYVAGKEHYLFNKYKADPTKKIFIGMIERDRADLVNHPDKYKRIAATMDTGLAWYNMQRYDLAIYWWKRGLIIEPNNPLGWYNLGNAYREEKNYKAAEKVYLNSMEVADKDEIDACLALGEMYRYQYLAKRNQENNVYLVCLEKSPDNRDLIARLAIYYRDSGDKGKALKYFDKLFSIEPTADVAEEIRKLRIE